MKRSFIPLIAVIVVLLFTSCKLTITSFDAPDTAETGIAVNLLITATADETGDGATEHGVIVQVPESWQVLYGKVQVPGYGEFDLSQRPDYAALYTPQAGYKIWLGTAGQGQGQSTTLTFKVRVWTGDFQGNLGDTEVFTLKAAVGVFRESTWLTDDPEQALDFNTISHEPYVETISVSKAEDLTAPDPVSTLHIENNLLLGVGLSWAEYDEEAQGDVVNYRIYKSLSQFSNISGMMPEGVINVGTLSYTITGLSFGATYYFAVTAVDELGNENVNVTSLSYTPIYIPPFMYMETYGDAFGDGIPGLSDNCPFIFNSGQEDANGDGIGDACDGSLIEDFESGGFTGFPWTMGGDGSWEINGTEPIHGAYSAQSSQIGDNERAWLETTQECRGGGIGFWYSVNSLESSDFLNFYVDNALVGSWSGFVDYTRAVFSVSPGVHSFRWEYVKDGSASAGTDRVMVDDIVIYHLNQALDGAISGVVKRESDSQPISGLWVYAYDNETGYGLCAQTQADGTYIITGLANGTCRVEVATQGTEYSREYYNNTSQWNLAQPVTVTVGQTTTGIDFSLAIGGSIDGVVTRASDGLPVSGLNVDTYDPETGYWGGGALTGSDGSYVIGGLPTGNYRVEVGTSGTDYIREYYDNTYFSSSATMVPVTIGQPTAGIDFILEVGWSISGVVTDDSSGLPIPNIGVVAYDYDNASGDWMSLGFTDQNGAYVLRGLPSGTYRVEVDPWGTDYARECFGQGINQCNPVSVITGQSTTGINFGLSMGGTIRGLVTLAANGQPAGGIQVSAYDHTTGTQKGYGLTQPDGSYAIVGLPTGNYRVELGTWGTDYVRKYYNDTYFRILAASVPVTEGQTTSGVDFTLEVGWSVSGKVTRQSDGDPLANIYVYAYDFATGEWISSASTQPDGSYVIRGLPEGAYRIEVSPWGTDYVRECYAEPGNPCSQIQVTAGQDRTDIDFSLKTGGRISGVVKRESDGQPIPGLQVNAWDHVDEFTWRHISWVMTQSDGSYVIGGLPSGNYVVDVASWGTDYVREFYNNKYDFNSADLVPVIAGQTTAGIDFSLAVLAATVAQAGVIPLVTPGNPNVQTLGSLSVTENFPDALTAGVIRIIAPAGVTFAVTSTATGFLSAPTIGTTFSTNDTLFITATLTSGIDSGTINIQGFVAAGVSGMLTFQVVDGNSLNSTQNTGIPNTTISPLAYAGTPEPLTAIPASITVIRGGSAVITIQGGVGAITGVSSDAAVATVTVVGLTVTVSGIGAGSAVITVADSWPVPSTVTINVTVISEFNSLKGDLDIDGNVDLMDAILALRIIAGIPPGAVVAPEADVDADGRIGIGEVLFILQKTAALRGSGLQAVSPSNFITQTGLDTGFPIWYQDFNNLKLELCALNNGLCLLAPPIDPGIGVGEETFWWVGETSMLFTGGDALLVLALEAAFAGGPLVAGDQISFGRIRIRIHGLNPGSVYTIIHPFGTQTFTTDAVGGINFTEDIGCLASPCDLGLALGSGIESFLFWDTGLPVLDPAGVVGDNFYIGDAATPHRVLGSPTGNNFFRIERNGALVAETNLFIVSGKVFTGDGNTPPTSEGDTVETMIGIPVVMDVLANDVAPDIPINPWLSNHYNSADPRNGG